MKPNVERIKPKRDSGRSNKKEKKRDITNQTKISNTGKEKKNKEKEHIKKGIKGETKIAKTD